MVGVPEKDVIKLPSSHVALKYLQLLRMEKILYPYRQETFAVTPKYDNYQLWIPGRQVGFVAESGKIPACK